MEVDATSKEEDLHIFETSTKTNRKKLANEEKAAVRLLGLCYFC
jgi:hypothetical protein